MKYCQNKDITVSECYITQKSNMESILSPGQRNTLLSSVTSVVNYALRRLLLFTVICIGLTVVGTVLLVRLLTRSLRWLIPNSTSVLTSSLQYTLTWLLWVVRLARWDLLLYRLVKWLVTPVGFWHMSGAQLWGPIQMALSPLVRGITLGLWIIQAFVQAQFGYVRWSASGLMNIVVKLLTPAGFWHQLGEEQVEDSDDQDNRVFWEADNQNVINLQAISDVCKDPKKSKSALESWSSQDDSTTLPQNPAGEDCPEQEEDVMNDDDTKLWLSRRREEFEKEDGVLGIVEAEVLEKLTDILDECETKPEVTSGGGVSYPDWMMEDLLKHRTVLKQYNTRMSLVRYIPLRTLSRYWGWINQEEIPYYMRGVVYQMYTWLYGCRLDETDQPQFSTYRNLSEFFQRRLKPGVRPVNKASLLTSPADGKVLHCGVAKDGVLEQIKGLTYSMQGFLGPPEGVINNKHDSGSPISDKAYAQQLKCSSGNELYYCIIYLAPGDYHRFHSPADCTFHWRRHFPGELFSVGPSVTRWLQGIFNMNERAVYFGKWSHGFFSMSPVGATNVGSINVYFDKELQTNRAGPFEAGTFYDECFRKNNQPGVKTKKGSLIGDFNLGSTVVLLFEAPPRFKFSISPGDVVSVGQGIGTITRKCGRGKHK